MAKRTKRYIQVAALVLAFVVAASFTACSCSGRAIFDLQALEVESYDMAVINKAFDDAEKVARTSDDYMVVYRSMSVAINELENIVTQYKIASLKYDLDMSDSAARTTYLTILNDYQTVYTKYIALLSTVADNAAVRDDLLSPELIAQVREMQKMRDQEYVDIMQEVSELSTDYNDLASGTIVTIDGVEYSNDDIESMTRDQRNVWYEAYATAAGDILLDLRDKYNKLATKAGYDSYAKYAYAVEYERDYTPSDARTLHTAVKENFKGLYEQLLSSITTSKQSVQTSAHALSDFSSLFKEYFREMGGGMNGAYSYMEQCNLYVTTDSKTANTGAYSTYLSAYEAPYIYQHMDDVKNPTTHDLTTFIHEFGHYNAFYQNKGSSGPLDTMEIHSQANEWLFFPYLSRVTTANIKNLARQELASTVRFSIQMGCVMDELQQNVYSNPLITEGAQVTAEFERLLGEYGISSGGADYDFKYWWAKVGHSFSSPFYYISYAVSVIPALEIYQLSDSGSRTKAISSYNTLVSGASTNTFGEILTKASLKSPFNSNTISSLATFIKSKC